MIIPKEIRKLIDEYQVKGVEYGHTTFVWDVPNEPMEHYILMGSDKKEIFKLTKRGFEWVVSDEYKSGRLSSSITSDEY